MTSAASESPVETERLYFRRHTPDDFRACTDMWADPRVTRYIGGRGFTAEETWARILRYMGLWQILGFGYWAVCEKKSGAFVGDIGFADFKRDIQPSLDGIPEAGWAFVAAVHGRGYGNEVLGAALVWADRHIAASRTVCIVNPQNSPSIGIAEANGYERLDDVEYKGSMTRRLQRRAPSSNLNDL